ncbi:protein wech-like [Saccostrea cucullata]|uniref:protein wech-like n=1 Tax=Saccostrea cuccullata TaxID=36930 RepID=UPI002ED1AEA8
MGKVTQYNVTRQQIQTIQSNNKGQGLYKTPMYITENRNGDVIVSDFWRYAVVVTDCEGRYRFSYRGDTSESRLNPRGICTDALSHILVCDEDTHSVHMIDKDGYFLLRILTQKQGIYKPAGLCYDEKAHLLLVGSRWKNCVYVYRYIKRKNKLKYLYPPLEMREDIL